MWIIKYCRQRADSERRVWVLLASSRQKKDRLLAELLQHYSLAIVSFGSAPLICNRGIIRWFSCVLKSISEEMKKWSFGMTFHDEHMPVAFLVIAKCHALADTRKKTCLIASILSCGNLLLLSSFESNAHEKIFPGECFSYDYYASILMLRCLYIGR